MNNFLPIVLRAKERAALLDELQDAGVLPNETHLEKMEAHADSLKPEVTHELSDRRTISISIKPCSAGVGVASDAAGTHKITLTRRRG